ALDTAGHGATPRGDGPLTIPRLAADLAAVIDALGVERVDLFGYSDGGNIALVYAATHPERVRTLLTYGSNLRARDIKPGLLAVLHLVHGLYWLGGRFCRRLRAKGEVWALMTRQPNIDPATLANITARTRIMAGEKDVISREHTELIAASIPGAEAVFVPGADHFLPFKDPQRLASLLGANLPA
ncbi:MAG: alpha/beta hydrolase, partial [Promicromonosporaceae bacterium]|nr:alpha/beta hydrolase [Promicromonosporaceae bacterium]